MNTWNLQPFYGSNMGEKLESYFNFLNEEITKNK